MKKKRWKLVILIIGISFGILISVLLRSGLDTYAPVTLSSLDNMKEKVDILNHEVNNLEDIVKEKEEELESFKEISPDRKEVINKLDIDLITSKSKSGYLAIKGPGIRIKMFDNPEDEIVGENVNDDVIHDVDVLNIINDLRVADAEAISINGERVVGSSELKCGGPIIRINGRSVGTPFIIKAIGDPKLLMAAVNAPGTYGDALKNIYNIGFEPEEKDELFVPAYNGGFEFEYAKPKEKDGK